MLKLDPFTINVLTNDFETAGGELNCEDFILMMMQHLSDWKKNL